ncbi:hypothetical protein GH5_01565 [Leishmania sp. Ghana 2012 LV757]|uniref:hypothetical protein n=1 Tax=Leishmania sp. Ghana 2012 LV757 TaxID=2803181 RepID=UPI001B61E98E|nr:hypothetical protein GH5_01565 [Leishmania sp. Ghana 2012 LV757]
MNAKHRHSAEVPASPHHKAMPAALHSGDEVLAKKSKNKTARSPPVKRTSAPSDRARDEVDAKTTPKSAPWKARKPSNRKSSGQDVSKSSLRSLPGRGHGRTETTLRGSQRQDVPFHDGGDASSLTDYVLDSSRGSAPRIAQPSEMSGGGYFLPGWSIGSEVAPAVCGAGFPLKRPSSERCRHPRGAVSSSSSSSNAVPPMPEEHSRGPMDVSSSWTPPSQKSHLRGAGPQAAQRRMSGSSAACSAVFGHSQCYMTSSYSSSLRFSSPSKLQKQQSGRQQQQRKIAGIAPPNLNPKDFYPMLIMGPLSDPHRGTVDRCEALQPMRSRFGTVNGAVPAAVSPWADSSKLRSGNIARLNVVHPGNPSPLRAQQSRRAVDEASLPTRPGVGVLTVSQSPLQSFFWASISTRHRTTLSSATNGFDRGSMVLPLMYGTGKDGSEEGSLGLGRHETGPAGQSVPGDGYHSFFCSAAGPLPVSESHPKGGGAGAAEKSAPRRDQVHSLYGCMRNGVAVVSSVLSDDEDGGEDGEDERGQHKDNENVKPATSPQWLVASAVQNERISARNSMCSSAFVSSGQLVPKSSNAAAALARKYSIFGSSAWHGDGQGGDGDDQTSRSTDSRGSPTLYRKSTMNALRWMVEAGKGRLGTKKGGTCGDSDSDNEDSVKGDEDSVDGDGEAERRRRVSLARALGCAGLGKAAYGTGVDAHTIEVVGQSNTCSDEDADEAGDGECDPASQSRQAALECILPDMEKLSDLSEADEEVAVQEKQPALHTTPLLPFAGGGGGRGSCNAYQRTCRVVSHSRRPVFVHYCAQPRADIMLPAGFPGWSTGCGARAAVHLRNYGGCEQRSLSPQNENDGHEQLADFISPLTTNGSGACSIPSADAAPVACESPCPIFRQTMTTVPVHELLGLDPEFEIIRVKSPVWWRLPD